MRRTLAAAFVALVVGVAAFVVVLVLRDGSPSCGAAEHRVPADAVPAVFASPAAAAADDPRVRRLVAAAGSWGLGPVVGAVGFDYGRWLTVGALPPTSAGAGGLITWTKDNAVAGVLGTDLRPRWGVRQARVQHAWDAGDQQFLELQLAKDRPLQVSAYRLADGHPEWCASVGATPTRYGDPLATALLPDHDVLLVADATGPRATVTRRAASSGRPLWTRTLDSVDRGDAAVALGADLVVLGGRPAFELADASVPAPTGAALTAVDPATGRTSWTWGTGARAHVLGATPTAVVVEEQDGATRRLLALGRDGAPAWTAVAPAGTVDVALRGTTVVARTATALVGLDASTGRQRWRTALPSGGQFFPYGFDLDAQPMLDGDHLLLGTTAAVRSLDLATGRLTTHPLPTDGINTTYWPYQLVVAGDLVVVVTNTGAVALRHGPTPG